MNLCTKYIAYPWRTLGFQNALPLWRNQRHLVVTVVMCVPHRVYRVARAIFCRTFHHDDKISPARWGCGLHALPLSLYLPSPEKLWCTLQLIHSPYFSSTPICTLWCTLLVIMLVATAMRGRRWTIRRHCAIKKKKKIACFKEFANQIWFQSYKSAIIKKKKLGNKLTNVDCWIVHLFKRSNISKKFDAKSLKYMYVKDW